MTKWLVLGLAVQNATLLTGAADPALTVQNHVLLTQELHALTVACSGGMAATAMNYVLELGCTGSKGLLHVGVLLPDRYLWPQPGTDSSNELCGSSEQPLQEGAC